MNLQFCRKLTRDFESLRLPTTPFRSKQDGKRNYVSVKTKCLPLYSISISVAFRTVHKIAMLIYLLSD